MKMFSNRTGGWIPALILAVMLAIGIPTRQAQAQPGVNISFQTFYDELSPYGQWFNDPQYGYVWAPSVGRDFRPYYTNGYWVMTDYGNMWMSDYNWGWAPFHYGRWAMSDYYGWIWVPGNEWGPAWVNWRQGGGYYGWAPMGPGVSINISFGPRYNVPNPWWTFIPCGNIYSRSFHRYYSPRRTVNIINNTTIINNTYLDNRSRTTYVTGPRRSDVETATRQRVTVYNVNDRSRAGAANVSGRNVSIYRPRVEANPGRGQERPAPHQAKTLDRSVISTSGGGRETPSRVTPGNNDRNRAAVERDRATIERNNERNERINRAGQERETERVQRDRQAVQRNEQQRVQREQAEQRNQQIQQQKVQREQVERQRDQQVQQQQRMQREQAEQQRNQQMQQQRAQREQMERQRDQQVQQQRQRDQQVQQQRVQRDQQIQQQRSQERAPQQRVERAAPSRSDVQRSPGRR
jgi:hypothetical protein